MKWRRRLRGGLASFAQPGRRAQRLLLLAWLAGVAGSREEPARAARLWGAAELVQEASGIRPPPIHRSEYEYEDRVVAARSRLGEFQAAWSEGRR